MHPQENVCHAQHSTTRFHWKSLHISENLIVVSVSQVHRCFGLKSHFFSFKLCAHWEKRKEKKSPFSLPWQRKPLIKTFLVCGILLDEGENSFLHILQNLSPISLLLLKICFTDVFVPFTSTLRSILRSTFISFSLLRDFVRNLLINIFLNCCLSATKHAIYIGDAWISRKFGLCKIYINCTA